MNELYERTLAIADRKVERTAIPGRGVKMPRLGTGGGFEDLFFWDTAFCAFWARYHADRFPIINSLDNFYVLQDEEGFISRQYSPGGNAKWRRTHPIAFAPPLLAWAELGLAETGRFPGRLARNFEALVRHHRYCRAHFRREDGLYFSDSWGCGMDNLPRWRYGSGPTPAGGIPLTPADLAPEDPADPWHRELAGSLCADPVHAWNRQCGWIDTSCQMAFDALNLARIARELGRPAEAAAFEREHQELADRINELCYSEADGFYFDRVGAELTGRRHVGAFWALLAEVAPPDRAVRLIRTLTEPARFGRPVPVPSLAADDPEYQPEGSYWRGPVWAPTTYMVLKGLDRCGRHDLARELAGRLYRAVEKIFRVSGTIWENYSPEQDERPQTRLCGRDFCGWSALIPIAIYREYLTV